jgi:hypothetical protein
MAGAARGWGCRLSDGRPLPRGQVAPCRPSMDDMGEGGMGGNSMFLQMFLIGSYLKKMIIFKICHEDEETMVLGRLGLGHVLMTKFGESKKIGLSDFLFRNIELQQFQGKTKEEAKFEDPRCFVAWKMTKKYQETKMEEIQARSKDHKNQTIRFWIPEYPVFPEQIESE